jgi:TonB family protein
VTSICLPTGHDTNASRYLIRSGVAMLALLMSSLTSSLAGAQAGPAVPISGVVVDSAGGVGIAGAQIAIAGTSISATTDGRGAFRLPDGGGRAATILVRRLGFRPRTLVVATAQQDEPMRVVLSPSVQAIAPVEVRADHTRYSGRLAGYYQRLEKKTQGLFITRADLEREKPAQLTDMLQRSPGVRITRGRPGAQSVRMRGRDCRPMVWLDGAPMASADVDLDSFSPASLEGIEMYLGSNTAPPRYQMARGQSECGTILLWSRSSDSELHAPMISVSPETLEMLIASLSVYSSDEVDTPVSLEAWGVWEVPYPPAMRASGEFGSVVAEFVVDTLGRVERQNFGIVSSTHAQFTEAVSEAVRAVVFRPAMRQGRKVRQLVRQPFDFVPPGK